MSTAAPKPTMLERLASRNADEIRERRAAMGISQARLAELAGTSQQTVDRIERGITTASRFIPEIRRALGLHTIASDEEMQRALHNDMKVAQALVDAVVDPVERELAASDAFVQKMREQAENNPFMMPVFSLGRANGEQLLFEEPARLIMRPEPLGSVKGAYAYFMYNDEMTPVFSIGDLLLVDPTHPCRPGDDVLLRSPRTGADAVKVRTLTDVGNDAWTARTWSGAPPETFNYSDWPTCHLIVGKFSRL